MACPRMTRALEQFSSHLAEKSGVLGGQDMLQTEAVRLSTQVLLAPVGTVHPDGAGTHVGTTWRA